MMSQLCDKCGGELEKVRVKKGRKGWTCEKCKSKTNKERWYKRKLSTRHKVKKV
jgi:reverse gyrase